jgi:hypothetical protein
MVLSRFLKRSGSMPAEEQTALKSWLSWNRNCSALRLKLSGPQIHSSKVFVMTARQSLSSAVPRSLKSKRELLSMHLPPMQIWIRLSALLYAGEGPQLHQNQKEVGSGVTNSGASLGMIRNKRLGRLPHHASLGTTFPFDNFWRGESACESCGPPREWREFFAGRMENLQRSYNGGVTISRSHNSEAR